MAGRAPTPRMQHLLNGVLSSVRISKAAGTWSAYEPHLQRWVAFCEDAGVSPLAEGAEAGQLAAMFLQSVLQDASTRKLGPSSVHVASAAVSALHELAGLASPCASPLASAVRKAAVRSLHTAPTEQAVVSPVELKKLVKHHLYDNTPDLRTRMLVTGAVVAFAGLLRWSDLSRVLVHRDLLRLHADRAELFLYTSKTDQCCNGALVTIGRIGGKYCPVGLLEVLLDVGGYKQNPATAPAPEGGGAEVDTEDVGPLMRAVARGSMHGGQQRLEQVAAVLPQLIRPLSYSTFAKGLARLWQAAGITRALPPHALRRGGATAAVNGGADRIMVQKLGRWRSERVFETAYVREDNGRKREVTARMGLPAADDDV